MIKCVHPEQAVLLSIFSGESAPRYFKLHILISLHPTFVGSYDKSKVHWDNEIYF